MHVEHTNTAARHYSFMASVSCTIPSYTRALKNTFLGEDNGLRAQSRRNRYSRVSSLPFIIQCKESRIGKVPIQVPSNVELALDGQFVKAKGPLGELSLTYPNEIRAERNPESGLLKISKAVETRKANQMHGLFRTLTSNIVVGVSEGFVKKLQLVGVGYRATVEGTDLVMNLGFSHPVRIAVPQGLKVTVEENTRISVTGRDKSAIGDFAAKIRKWRPPEPYKGKGIRYADEKIKLKEGKAGKKK